MPGHHLSPGSQGPAPGPPGIPQASVRPLVRPAKHEPMDPDIKPHVQSEYSAVLHYSTVHYSADIVIQLLFVIQIGKFIKSSQVMSSIHQASKYLRDLT